MEYVADRAPAGWREAHASESDPDNLGYTPLSETQEVDSNARKSAWARMIAKVYEIDPLVCPECGAEDEWSSHGELPQFGTAELQSYAVIENPG